MEGEMKVSPQRDSSAQAFAPFGNQTLELCPQRLLPVAFHPSCLAFARLEISGPPPSQVGSLRPRENREYS
jgi:hypothetical protein